MATIIKTHTPPQPSGTALRAVAYDLTDMGARADGYLADVEREAARIIEQARKEAVAIRQEAEVAGRRAAEQAIERVLDEKVARQMKTLIPALQVAVKQIEDAKQQWLAHWETVAVHLAVAIAERLVRGELARRPEISVDWVRQALELAAGCADAAIQLHPDDQQALAGQAQQIAAALHPLARVQVVADETISPGGCRVVTEFGVIDVQLEEQLERIKQELA